MINLSDVIVQQGVPATMRDGTVLYADVYRPKTDEPLPVILMRMPYNRQQAAHVPYAHPAWYARQGYMVVIQDTRGRWASEGKFYPFRHEMTDGYDTVEWAARLPGSKGKVGMYGFSYPGATQLMAAVMRPPHLTCIIPGFTNSGFYDGWTYSGGAFNLAFNLSWGMYLAIDTAHRQGLNELERELVASHLRISEWYDFLPLLDMALMQKVEPIAPYIIDWLNHPSYDDYWKAWSIAERYGQISVPALHFGGWYDAFREGTLRNFSGIRQSGIDEHTRENQRLLMGPWYHNPWLRQSGDIDFGDAAINGMNEIQLAWFDHWLKGRGDLLWEEAPVRLFVMGDNVWRSWSEWPPTDVEYRNLYLHSLQGNASSPDGDGILDQQVPGDEPPDIFVYDPRWPVPSVGGHSCCVPQIAPMGPADQRPIEYQGQVLVFTSEVLQDGLTVIGACTATLWVASSAVDTDFTAKLVDVYPDGRAMNLTEGILRARYRNSLEEATLLKPFEIYQLTIQIGSTCNVFKAGHRIRIEISSSNFPHWDRNTNTGRIPSNDQLADVVVATQIIFHDAQHPSHVTLPVLAS